MADKNTDRAALLPQTLEAAGHEPAAVNIARVAAKQRLAPTTTLELLGTYPQAAGVARVVLLGADVPDAETPGAEAVETPGAEAEPTPLTPAAAAHSAMNEEMRRQVGFPTAGEAAANPSPPASAESAAHAAINDAMRSLAGFNPDTKE